MRTSGYLPDDARRLADQFGGARVFRCPASDCYSHKDTGRRWTLRFLIPHLNDCHRWKRERIADWLASEGL